MFKLDTYLDGLKLSTGCSHLIADHFACDLLVTVVKFKGFDVPIA